MRVNDESWQGPLRQQQSSIDYELKITEFHSF